MFVWEIFGFMILRHLKLYIWAFDIDKGTVILFDKKENITMTLPMNKADSFVRAYISFKNRERIEKCKELKTKLRSQREVFIARIAKLKLKIKASKKRRR